MNIEENPIQIDNYSQIENDEEQLKALNDHWQQTADMEADPGEASLRPRIPKNLLQSQEETPLQNGLQAKSQPLKIPDTKK